MPHNPIKGRAKYQNEIATSRVLRWNETNVKSVFYRKRDPIFKRHFRHFFFRWEENG